MRMDIILDGAFESNVVKLNLICFIIVIIIVFVDVDVVIVPSLMCAGDTNWRSI